MSRQSKNRKNRERAAEYTRLHKQGQRGPKATIPVHGKSANNRAYSVSRRGMKDKPNRKTSRSASTDSVAE